MRGARLRLVAQTLALPAVVLVIAVTWALWVLPELPDPVATRFGADLAATDFAPPGTFIAVVAITTAFTAAPYCCCPACRRGARDASSRASARVP